MLQLLVPHLLALMVGLKIRLRYNGISNEIRLYDRPRNNFQRYDADLHACGIMRSLNFVFRSCVHFCDIDEVLLVADTSNDWKVDR